MFEESFTPFRSEDYYHTEHMHPTHNSSLEGSIQFEYEFQDDLDPNFPEFVPLQQQPNNVNQYSAPFQFGSLNDAQKTNGHAPEHQFQQPMSRPTLKKPSLPRVNTGGDVQQSCRPAMLLTQGSSSSLNSACDSPGSASSTATLNTSVANFCFASNNPSASSKTPQTPQKYNVLSTANSSSGNNMHCVHQTTPDKLGPEEQLRKYQTYQQQQQQLHQNYSTFVKARKNGSTNLGQNTQRLFLGCVSNPQDCTQAPFVLQQPYYPGGTSSSPQQKQPEPSDKQVKPPSQKKTSAPKTPSHKGKKSRSTNKRKSTPSTPGKKRAASTSCVTPGTPKSNSRSEKAVLPCSIINCNRTGSRLIESLKGALDQQLKNKPSGRVCEAHYRQDLRAHKKSKGNSNDFAKPSSKKRKATGKPADSNRASKKAKKI